jgi:penicillin-binding protein 1A
MKTAHGKFCGAFPAPKHPFVSTPFFGKYATTGVKDNKIDPSSYEKDTNGGSALETGKAKGNGGTNADGTTKYPSDQYQTPPQTTPNTATPGTTGNDGGTGTPTTPATPATQGTPTTGAGGGIAPPP